MNGRALFVMVGASVVAFAVVMGGLLALASGGPTVQKHVRHAFASGLPIGAAAAGPSASAEFAGKGCTIIWTDRTHNHDWHTPANWSPVRLPGPDDVACIPAGTKVVIKHDLKVKGFINHGDLTLACGNANFGSGENG